MTYEYKPDDKFGYKDTLPEGHDEKIIKGGEFDDEFKKISNAFKTFDPDFDGDIDIDSIDGLQDALDTERQERIDADANLQGQIDALDPDGDLKVDWSEIQDKPTEFPPEDHTQGWETITDKPDDYPPSTHDHEIAEINGLQDALDSAGGTPSWDDVTGKPTEFPPAAHNQGWDTITGTPSEYPPEDHTHDQYALAKDLEDESKARVDGDAALASDIADLEAAVGIAVGQLAFGGSYDASTGLVDRANLSSLEDGQPLPDSSTVLGTFVIVAVAGDNPEELTEADWLVAGDSDWVAIKYGTAGSVLWDNVVGAPDFLTDAQGSIDGDSKQYVRKNGAWVEATGDSPWIQNGDDVYYDAGSVGIGTDTVADFNQLHVKADGIAGALVEAGDAGGYAQLSVKTPEGEWITGMRPESSGNFIIRNSAVGNLVHVTPQGNVGIGTDNATQFLTIDNPHGDSPARSGVKFGQSKWTGAYGEMVMDTNGASSNVDINASGSANFITLSTDDTERVRIDSDGRVGIGMDPTRSTAKERLAGWKASFDARLKAEPKADKKAVTLEITDDAFEVLPTEKVASKVDGDTVRW